MTKISQRLDLRQSQQLVMTPQLQQAIKLLQLNNMELAEFVEEELSKNPLLEKAEPEPEEGEAAEQPVAESRDDVQAEFDESWTGNEAEPTAQTDFDPGSSMANIGAGGTMRFEDGENGFESQVTVRKTLRDHLTEQLSMVTSQPTDLAIGSLLIDQLDESGYLRTDKADLAKQLGCSPARIEKLVTLMQDFDPPGIFAHDLAECLKLQLEDRNALDSPMQKLLENLDLLGKHDHKKLCELCGVNETYLRDMIEEIRTLNPRPAAEFEHLVLQTAIPDVLMKRLPKHLGSGWRVELNAETLPRVLINQSYFTEVSQHATQKKDKDYLANQINSANWLVRALDQRAQTILKTAAAIVEEQDAFFNYGIEFMRPLTLRDIAETIQMHESTVSRVTTNKYIGTPRGIYELKFFFGAAIAGEDGAMHAAESVRARIKTMIESENPENILSDDKIVELLKAEGIDIARRTVAKYREGMNIASSVQRRREKKNR